MEHTVYYLIGLLILGAVLYAVVWALATDFFIDPVTSEFDAWKAVLWIAIFLVVLAILGYFGFIRRGAEYLNMDEY